jgi:hypothetical protein
MGLLLQRIRAFPSQCRLCILLDDGMRTGVRLASTSERELRKAYGIATIIVQLSRIFHVTNNVANGIFRAF